MGHTALGGQSMCALCSVDLPAISPSQGFWGLLYVQCLLLAGAWVGQPGNTSFDPKLPEVSYTPWSSLSSGTI